MTNVLYLYPSDLSTEYTNIFIKEQKTATPRQKMIDSPTETVRFLSL